MKTVKCIDDNWTDVSSTWVKNAIFVGETFPVAGEIYTVSNELYIFKNNQRGYQLEGFDFSAYGSNVGFFKAERFEVLSDIFTPNHYDTESGRLA